MDEDSLAGEGRDIAGEVKETVGDVNGSPGLKGEGLVDQLPGKLQKGVGVLRDGLGVDRFADQHRQGHAGDVL